MKKKNNKGFSLVELIIVIAIMVALIAVLAPSYVKYVDKSRKSAYENACEDFLSSIKECYADPERTQTLSDGTITISVPNGTSSFQELCTTSGAMGASSGSTFTYLIDAANCGEKKLQKVGSASTFVITISESGQKITMIPQ